MAAVEVVDLVKTYGELAAVAGVSFRIEEREVVALLGPNGAGKTTTVEILEGYRRRDSGSVDVLGFDPATGGRAYRARIGIVLQEAGFEDAFSVRELVRLQAGFYPSPRPVDDVIEMVDLVDKADARVKTLSGGQRRRLDLALGIVGNPEVLFLDEPTTGFDPSARRRAWELIDRLRDLGTTILLTTHYMDEAEHLADRLLVMARGLLVAEGTADELAADAGAETRISFQLPTGLSASDLPSVGAGTTLVGDGVELRSLTPTADVHALTGWALERGVDLVDLGLARPDLEDVYLRLTDGAGSPELPSEGEPES
ncbi:MAG: ABC transporter ATP-binding protein [Candidatus Nanopelagicales bacterium]